MKDDKILYTIKDNVCLIKLTGMVQCSTISGFDSFVKMISKDKSIQDVIIDLCNLEYIDSTNLGLIAEIARFMIKEHNRKPAIVTTNAKITDLIENMGFKKIFIVIKGLEISGGEMREVPDIQQDEEEKAKMILEAHKAIMEISEKNKSLFKDVVELLEDQLDTPEE